MSCSNESKVNRRFLTSNPALPILILTMSTAMSGWGEEFCQTGLNASLELNKLDFIAGDVIEISVHIKNTCDYPVLFDKTLPLHTSARIKIYRRDGMPTAIWVRDRYMLAEFRRTLDDFVELKPGYKFEMKFAGQFSKSVEGDPSGPDTLPGGMYLDFKSDVILLPYRGTYAVTFEEQLDKEYSESVREFQIPNAWYGKIVSNPVIIKVK